jgi:hypothetical protein
MLKLLFIIHNKTFKSRVLSHQYTNTEAHIEKICKRSNLYSPSKELKPIELVKVSRQNGFKEKAISSKTLMFMMSQGKEEANKNLTDKSSRSYSLKRG